MEHGEHLEWKDYNKTWRFEHGNGREFEHQRTSGRKGNRGGWRVQYGRWFPYRYKRGDLRGKELEFPVKDTMGL